MSTQTAAIWTGVSLAPVRRVTMEMDWFVLIMMNAETTLITTATPMPNVKTMAAPILVPATLDGPELDFSAVMSMSVTVAVATTVMLMPNVRIPMEVTLVSANQAMRAMASNAAILTNVVEITVVILVLFVEIQKEVILAPVIKG